MKYLKRIKGIHVLLFIVLSLIITYIVLLHNPIVIYKCDIEVANEIMSKEEIKNAPDFLSVFKEYRIFRPLIIVVFNPVTAGNYIDLLFIPVVPQFSFVLTCARNGPIETQKFNNEIDLFARHNKD